MSISVVGLTQKSGAGSGTGVTIVANPANHTTGNTLVVGVISYNSGAGCSITDTAGNDYEPIGTLQTLDAGVSVYLFLVLSCIGNAANAVTAHLSGSDVGYQAMHVYEVSGDGLYLVDASAKDLGPTLSSGPLAFTDQEAIILGFMTALNPGFTGGTGFTLTNTSDGSGGYSASEYKLVTTTEPATASVLTAFWIMSAVALGIGSPPSSNSLLAFQEMPSTAAATLNETSVKREVRLWDDLGQPKTGVVAADVTCRYRTNGGALASRSVVAGTIGTYLANSLVEIDATYAPGAYQWCPANTDVDAIGDQIFTFKGTDIFGELVLSVSGTDVFAAASSLDEMGDKFLDVSAGVTIINDGTQAVLPYSTGNVTKTLERAERSTTIEGMS